MSMAEPRRRKKWSLNPRGTLWANDDNKYGQKLMEKMGWSKGSGLGREEQGIKEHLTVKFKDDNKGIGFTGSDDQWIKHYEGFESVLANLNSQENVTVNASASGSPYNSTVTKTSLETSSKASKARVHYHKFTRGKDLSRCSEDDLGCILGSKRAKRLAEVKSAEEDVTESDDAVGTIEHSMGVTTIKGCSIQEYFAQKMASLRNGAKCQPQSQEGGYATVSEEIVERPTFGASCDGREDTFNYPPTEKEVGKKKKKKKRQQVGSEGINTAESAEISENGIEEEADNAPDRKKKKKRKENLNISTADGIACEENTVKPLKRHLHTNNEENFQSKAIDNEEVEKKKKKKKHTDTVIEVKSISGETMKDKTKIRRNKGEYMDVNVENSYSFNEVQEQHEVKKKKRKKDRA